VLRRAVIMHLQTALPGLGGRVYEAFLAGPEVARPYATVKLATQVGSPSIGYAGTQPVEVRIYHDPGSFKDLDLLEVEVLESLNGVTVTDDADGSSYELFWTAGGGDFIDPERRLIGRLLTFTAACLAEPGGV